jgi:hypothetical protein
MKPKHQALGKENLISRITTLLHPNLKLSINEQHEVYKEIGAHSSKKNVN